MIELLTDVNFWVIALGTMCLGLAAGMVGSISVLRGQSLIGDAIGHSALPGVVVAVMLTGGGHPAYLLLGAAVSGFLAYLLIQMASQGKTTLDTVLAIVLSSFFGFGLVLKSYISGNPGFEGVAKSGLDNYIFGQAAYLRQGDLKLLIGISLAAILVMILFYKDIKIAVFDPGYAHVIGHRPRLIRGIILVLTLLLIAAGLKVVGAILIASMLIAPAVAALQWSARYGVVLGLAATFGAVSAFLGTVFSSLGRGLSTGPSIVLFMSCISIVSLIAGRHSPGARHRAGRRRKKEVTS